MYGRAYKTAVLLMWLALPTSAWEYRRTWNQLPPRMAVHFDANWQPNGYTSREGALELGLGIMAVMLVMFTLATLIIHALKPAAGLPAVLIAYVVAGILLVRESHHHQIQFECSAGPFRVGGLEFPRGE